jgi:hypothetical protein
MVVDIDPRNGGNRTLHELEDRHGPLPATLSVYTGGGGEHRWYRCPYAENRRATLGPGIDLKTGSVGGLLVAPPSVHHTGRRYAWTNRQLPPATVPTWLDDTTRPPQTNSGGAGRTIPTGKAAEGVIARQMAAAPVGERAVTLYRLACWAIETEDDIGALRLAARAVGLEERKITAQIQCARRKVGR